MQRIKAGKVVRPSQLVADYPLELEAIVMKALQVDPRDRFLDADGMRRAIEALGHRMHFVLGDAAVIEVMTQLFEQPIDARASGAFPEVPSRASDPAFEWIASEHDLTVRRDPKELLEAMRAHLASGEAGDGALVSASASASFPPIAMKPRKLRAATQAAESLIVQSVDAPGVVAALPLASPPPTPHQTPLPGPMPGAAGSTAGRVAGPNPVSVKFALPRPTPPSTAVAMVGATMVKARSGWGGRVRWLALAVLFAAIAAASYLVIRDDSGAAAGSASPVAPPPPPPAAARAPQGAPAPSKPVHPPAPPLPEAPPPLPTMVRVQIVSHPSDATVFLDGRKLGKTPLDEAVAADAAKHVFKLKRKGYAMARLDLELGADVTEEVTLIPQK
jgi:hypothetical protein